MIKNLIDFFIKFVLIIIVSYFIIEHLLKNKCSDFIANGIIIIVALCISYIYNKLLKRDND